MPVRLFGKLVALVLLLGLGAVPARATDLAALLDAVADNAAFDPSMRADLKFETKRGTDTITRTAVIYGRDQTVRVEMPDGRRGLTKSGKAVFAQAGKTPKRAREQVIGGTAFLLEDLAPFTSDELRVPLINDEGPNGIVVAGEPTRVSPYVLLALTIPEDRPLVTAAKYYRWEVNNLTKMTHVKDAVQVGGHWRPAVIDLQDLAPGGDATTITFTWQERPGLPLELFLPSGLATDVPQ